MPKTQPLRERMYHWQEGKPKEDAPLGATLAFKVEQVDVEGAIPLDPTRCAEARCIHRYTGRRARVYRDYLYIERDTYWERWRMRSALNKAVNQLDSPDEDVDFPVGVYEIAGATWSQRLLYRRGLKPRTAAETEGTTAETEAKANPRPNGVRKQLHHTVRGSEADIERHKKGE